MFGINRDDIRCEMTVLKNMVRGVPSYETIKDHLTKETFPNLFQMVQVAITLPVSSATCDWSFSAMRRINTYIRSTMFQDRFSNLAIMNIERDIDVDNEIILKIFSKSERKIKL